MSSDITGLAGILVWTAVDRFDAMRAFYVTTLGLAPRSDRPGFVNFDWGRTRLTVAIHDGVAGHASDPLRIMINLRVADIDTVHARLADAGVEFIRTPEAESWGGRVATFADPDGNTLQLLEFPGMISVEAARRLKDAGLKWEPKLHDFFAIPDRDLDGRRFVLSDMSIDVEHIAGYGTLMFNGAVEWSLDYIFRDEVIWLPTEGQLRDLLDDRLVALRRTTDGYEAEISAGDGTTTHRAPAAADAYAAALLATLVGEK